MSDQSIEDFLNKIQSLHPEWDEDTILAAKDLFRYHDGVTPENVIRFTSVQKFFEHIGHNPMFSKRAYQKNKELILDEVQRLYRWGNCPPFEYCWHPFINCVTEILTIK